MNDATATSRASPRKKIFSRIRWRGAASIASFFILWHLAVEAGITGFAELPTPVETLRAFFAEYIADAAYWNSWLVSFKRVLYGFIIAQILGIPLGLLFGTSRKFRDLFFPVFELLRPIPPLAWVPISILFWPTNESSIVIDGRFAAIDFSPYHATVGDSIDRRRHDPRHRDYLERGDRRGNDRQR